MLVNELRDSAAQQLQRISDLPAQAQYTFDTGCSASESPTKACCIEKTQVRTVVTLNIGMFQAKEVVRREKTNGQSTIRRSLELPMIVAHGQRYGYDLIAKVGCRTYLDGWKMNEIKEEICPLGSGRKIPMSSLYDIQHKFLFYLGELHRQAAPRLKEHFQKKGNSIWEIDGTIEPGTPCFFGIKKVPDDILVGSWKIPTENEDDIARCLTEAAELYGAPERILRDLSERMRNACFAALPNVRQYVCHQHFASDVGGDLYEEPQKVLSKRLRAMKLQVRLKDQRSAQTQRLRRAIDKPEVSLVLPELLDGQSMTVQCFDTFWREVLLAFQFWILDYARDGKRQGFPFDPYLLYFHRRVVSVHKAVKELLSSETVSQNVPRVFLGFFNKLDNYVTDKVIIQARSLYEKASSIFKRLRETLRLFPIGPDPMNETYDLDTEEPQAINRSLTQLRKEFAEESLANSNSEEQKLYEIANRHLDKYAPYLLPANATEYGEAPIIRTTGSLELHWWDRKRVRRQTNGRRNLTRDFNALPPEFMLVPNLRNPTYVELVLENSDNLAEKLAVAGRTAGPFCKWRSRNKPLNIGRIPIRILRKENFVDSLLELCESQ